MARMNAECGLWVVDLLEVQPQDRVLEVGFGPGVVIELLSNRAREGLIAGVDPSREMVAQAQARNAAAIQRGSVDLRFGSVEQLPFPDNSFDKAIAVNSMQVWPDAPAGLREIRNSILSSRSRQLNCAPAKPGIKRSSGTTLSWKCFGYASAFDRTAVPRHDRFAGKRNTDFLSRIVSAPGSWHPQRCEVSASPRITPAALAAPLWLEA
jgi:SAM-dependent methyltransferase